MYFTRLPDNTKPGFDEQLHFSKFKKNNIIFNAVSSYSHCDYHVGCLSFKTVLSGEEWYGIDNYRLAIRPGQFLILNDDQTYSCAIEKGEKTKVLSIFFKKEFASSVFQDILHREEILLDNPIVIDSKTLEFFQTLNNIDSTLQIQLSNLISSLNNNGYDSCMVDEQLVFLLQHLIQKNKSEIKRTKNVSAIKPNTRMEIYKRLCIAKDILHSSYMDKPDLNAISKTACLSVPQLIRQFKYVFHATPHQYLLKIKLKRAIALLKHSDKPIHQIAWSSGFENVSAFCRAFKLEYGTQPNSFRKII